MADDRRYYGLDALRGIMMLLGIVLHSAGFYVAAPPPHLPITTDPHTSIVMDGIVDFIHAFRMPAFFVLAGFFAALLVEKRGVSGALKNRAARIGGPFLAGMLTIVPITLLFLVDFTISARYGKHGIIPELADLRRLGRETAHDMAGLRFSTSFVTEAPAMHLWFLMYLCYFYLLIPFCRMLVRWSLPFEAGLTRFLGSPVALPVFALWTAATLWPYPGAMVFGDFIFVGFSPAAFAYYGSFFVIGYLYHHYRAATAQVVRHIRWCALVALVAFPLAIHASYGEFAHHSGEVGYHALVVLLHGLTTWSLIWLCVGLALRFLDRPTPWALYASQSSYWVYLLHLPVIGLVAWLMVPLDLPAQAKFAVVAAVTTVVCFGTYHYGVQRTWIGVFLHGKRFNLDWPWRPMVAAVQQL